MQLESQPSFVLPLKKLNQQNYTWEQIKYYLQYLQSKLGGGPDKTWLASEGSDLVNRYVIIL